MSVQDDLSSTPSAQNEAAETPETNAGDQDLSPGALLAMCHGLEQENADLKARLLRALADVENQRKRANQQKEEGSRSALASFTKDLLPIMDNFGRALDVKSESGALLEGVRMIYQDMENAFKRVGVVRYESLGHAFDPEMHQAVGNVASENEEPGTVVKVLEEGYKINYGNHASVLRVAMVLVSTSDPV